MHRSFDNDLEVRVVFLNVFNAFDKFFHNGLTLKLDLSKVLKNCISLGDREH